jgi:hypothetical protein
VTQNVPFAQELLVQQLQHQLCSQMQDLLFEHHQCSQMQVQLIGYIQALKQQGCKISSGQISPPPHFCFLILVFHEMLSLQLNKKKIFHINHNFDRLTVLEVHILQEWMYQEC